MGKIGKGSICRFLGKLTAEVSGIGMAQVVSWPRDDNGDALRRMAANGDELTIPREIDFAVVFPDQANAERFVSQMVALGYSAAIQAEAAHADTWDVSVVKCMAATYGDISAFESLLQRTSEPLGGYIDGWGCFSQASAKSDESTTKGLRRSSYLGHERSSVREADLANFRKMNAETSIPSLYTTATATPETCLSTASATLWGFTLASLLLFGFMTWKPQIWVFITPFKRTWSRDKLFATYRWLGAVVVAGVLVNLALMLTLWKG